MGKKMVIIKSAFYRGHKITYRRVIDDSSRVTCDIVADVPKDILDDPIVVVGPIVNDKPLVETNKITEENATHVDVSEGLVLKETVAIIEQVVIEKNPEIVVEKKQETVLVESAPEEKPAPPVVMARCVNIRNNHVLDGTEVDPPTRKANPNKLSVVVTGRNDNYDGNFDERIAIALGKNMASLPGVEFIYVEWNPLSDRKPLAAQLKKMYPKLRCFVVHPKFHERYCTIDGFLEYPAKNVGIRRASGDYVLSTNSDIIFSPEVCDKLRFSDLDKNTVYRATRVDIPMTNLDVNFPLKEQDILEVQKGITNACGDFLMLHKKTWSMLTGYCEDFPGQRLHKDSFALYILVNIFRLPWRNFGQITHWRHPSSWSSKNIRPRLGDIYWDYTNCGYKKNRSTWGLTYTKELKKDGLTWLV
jgi:glycosyltransferase involved in cell wall biosynthesis